MQNFRQQESKLCGDVLLTTAFVSYLGFFTKGYRQSLMDGTWRPYLSQLKVRTAGFLLQLYSQGALLAIESSSSFLHASTTST